MIRFRETIGRLRDAAKSLEQSREVSDLGNQQRVSLAGCVPEFYDQPHSANPGYRSQPPSREILNREWHVRENSCSERKPKSQLELPVPFGESCHQNGDNVQNRSHRKKKPKIEKSGRGRRRKRVRDHDFRANLPSSKRRLQTPSRRFYSFVLNTIHPRVCYWKPKRYAHSDSLQVWKIT